jgi:hypothetical protein
MDDFKNTTKTVYTSGSSAVKGAAGAAKANSVMRAFKTGGVVRLPVDPDYEDEGVMRLPRPSRAPAAPPRSLVEARAQKAAPKTDLDRTLSTLPSQRGEMLVGKAKGGLAVKKC